MRLIHQINDMSHDVKLVSQVMKCCNYYSTLFHVACLIDITWPQVVIIYQKLQESMEFCYYLILDD
jgi:hypothetical protein